MEGNMWAEGVALIVVGAIVYIAGLVLKSRSFGRRPYPGYAEAKVVAIIPVERERSALSEFRNRQAAVFEFFADGKLVKVTDRKDVYPCPYSLNQHVRLCYDPEDPQKYAVIGKESLLSVSYVLNVLGVFLILGGVLAFLSYALRYAS